MYVQAQVGKKNSRNGGLTLVELLIILVILSIIGAISTIATMTIVDNNRRDADHATVLSLNRATYYYTLTTTHAKTVLLSAPNDETRMEVLVQNGYLDAMPKQQHPDTIYVFSQDHFLWCLIDCGLMLSGDTLFAGWSLEDFLTRSGSTDHFSIEDGILRATPPQNSDDIVFFSNPNVSYTITATVQIEPRLDGNNWGGVGILFETTSSSPDRDSGYILQLDRHYGQVIVRARNNGNEGGNNNILLRYDVVFNNGTVGYVQNNGSTINRDVRDHPWWEEVHTIVMRVNAQGTDKTLTVSIDGSTVFTWDIPNPVAPEDASLNQTGVRAWWNVPVKIFDITVSEE